MSTCTRTQGFGQNLAPLYAEAGQKRGHTGVDDTCGYGSKIYPLKKSLVYKILDDKHPANDGSGYWGIFMIAIEPDGRLIEWQIGHCSKIYVKPGDIVEPWDFIGEEGNRGGVFSGGVRITKAMQDAGDLRGSHRHYNKKYLVSLTEAQRDIFRGAVLTEFSISSLPNLYKNTEGLVYGVLDYYNGYNGGVDCAKDIDDGRKLVRDHFANLQTSPPPSPSPTQTEDEKLKLSMMQQILNLISSIVSIIIGRRNR